MDARETKNSVVTKVAKGSMETLETKESVETRETTVRSLWKLR